MLLGAPSAGQDTHTPVLGPNNSIELVEAEGAKESANVNAVMQGFAAGNWFAVQSELGAVQAYVYAPEGSTLPAGLLTELDPGQAIVKSEAPSFFGLQPPSAQQITALIEGMLSNARSSVCTMGSGRPSTFGTAVDVSAGIGITGTIQFSAEWETAQLCQGL
jgi:hypothetical protein